MDLVLFGIQGSGKGTQSKAVAEKYSMKIFEAGAECRKLALENSELGLKVKEIIDSGNLVPASTILEILDNFLSKIPASQPLIYDGIPRNYEQEKEFDLLLKKYSRNIMAIKIHLPQEETIKRLLARARHDDVPEIITKRIQNFYKHTSPIIEHYRAQNKVIDIDGNQDIDKVSAEIFSKLNHYYLKTPSTSELGNMVTS